MNLIVKIFVWIFFLLGFTRIFVSDWVVRIVGTTLLTSEFMQFEIFKTLLGIAYIGIAIFLLIYFKDK